MGLGSVLARLRLLLRHALYVARGGFLVRPLVIAVVLGTAGMTLSWLEQQFPIVSSWAPSILFPTHSDPQVAQVILGGIAGSIMTVVSIVFAILLMTLTLASMQFSPRILLSFVRDRVTQWTLGVFLGTFCYCIAALPAARYSPKPFAPVTTVAGAMALALVCVTWLLFFIHHISQAISVNHIVDRIAGETEDVIDEIMPHPRLARVRHHPEMRDRDREQAVASATSGYIRFVDTAELMELAKAKRLRIRLLRRVGQFIPAEVPLFMLLDGHRLEREEMEALLAAVDIGPVRTLQQDVEFGVLQIVDIALRAISPAVNDPSTAINGIDQLSRIMIRWIGRDPPETYLSSPPHVVRVVIPWITTPELLETAFEQIRHYATSDLAVSLRLVRAFGDLLAVAEAPGLRSLILESARRVVAGSALGAEDIARLEARLQRLEQAVAPGAGGQPETYWSLLGARDRVEG